jgi:hypothetical protein
MKLEVLRNPSYINNLHFRARVKDENGFLNTFLNYSLPSKHVNLRGRTRPS